jgi:hypothetical protein
MTSPTARRYRHRPIAASYGRLPTTIDPPRCPRYQPRVHPVTTRRVIPRRGLSGSRTGSRIHQWGSRPRCATRARRSSTATTASGSSARRVARHPAQHSACDEARRPHRGAGRPATARAEPAHACAHAAPTLQRGQPVQTHKRPVRQRLSSAVHGPHAPDAEHGAEAAARLDRTGASESPRDTPRFDGRPRRPDCAGEAVSVATD